MVTMLVSSKLSPSELPCDVIERPAVLKQLSHAAHCSLILLLAPAGFGKTTTARLWLQNEKNIGWYQLDASDNQPQQFMRYFVAAFNQALKGAIGDKTHAAVERCTSIEACVSEVLAILAQHSNHCYLVLDDYHHINNPEIHQSMRFLIKHAPSHLSIVLLSRALPSLNVANLHVQGLIREITSDNLSFDLQETHRFLAQQSSRPIPSQISESWQGYTQGWPAALRLATTQDQLKSSNFQLTSDLVYQLNHDYLWPYLREEVLQTVNQQQQHFLLRCTICNDFNGTLAASITRQPNAQSLIGSLQHSGVFLSRVSGKNNRYRFHSIFADFLTDERQSQLPGEECQLHTLAAQSCLEEAEPTNALNHAHQAKDVELVTSILHQYAWQLINLGEWDVVIQALETLPQSQSIESPKLSLLQAWQAHQQGNTARTTHLLENFAYPQQGVSSNEQGEINALSALLAAERGHCELALELAERALSCIETNQHDSRVMATLAVAQANHQLGHLDRALPLMQQAEKFARQHHLHQQTLVAAIEQSKIFLALSRPKLAYEIQDNAFQFVEHHQLQHLPCFASLVTTRIELLFSWHKLNDIQLCLSRYKALLEAAKAVYYYSIQARLALYQGEPKRTSDWLIQLESALTASPTNTEDMVIAEQVLLICWQATDKTVEIERWLINALRPSSAANAVTQLQWRNIARAQVYLKQLEAATTSCEWLQEQAALHQLVSEKTKNWLMMCLCRIEQKEDTLARKRLLQALTASGESGMIGDFIIDGEALLPFVDDLTSSPKANPIEQRTARKIHQYIKPRNKNMPSFDSQFIQQLIHHNAAPELLKTSPLTDREWQVWGLIHAGHSNEHIAFELDVATTTIKTHIRNIYQKLAISNRKQAISTANSWVKLVTQQNG